MSSLFVSPTITYGDDDSDNRGALLTWSTAIIEMLCDNRRGCYVEVNNVIPVVKQGYSPAFNPARGIVER